MARQLPGLRAKAEGAVVFYTGDSAVKSRLLNGRRALPASLKAGNAFGGPPGDSTGKVAGANGSADKAGPGSLDKVAPGFSSAAPAVKCVAARRHCVAPAPAACPFWPLVLQTFECFEGGCYLSFTCSWQAKNYWCGKFDISHSILCAFLIVFFEPHPGEASEAHSLLMS